MPTISQEKRPNEKIRLSADFSNVLLSGDSIVGGNIAVTSKNADTDADSTSTIINSTALSGTSIIATVQAGTTGDVHIITFATGATSLGLSYESQMHLLISDSPASENPLISLDAAKRHLGITDTTEDALIEDLLLAASAYIRKRTGRDFTLTTYAETLQPLDREDAVKLQLMHYPIRKIDSIACYDKDDVLVWTTSTAADWDFVFEGYIWMVNTQYYFYRWPYKNVVTYRAGYPKIPEDLSRCCANIVSVLYKKIGREGLSEERIGNYMYRTDGPKDMPKSLRREFNDTVIEGVISRYRRHDLHFVGV